MARATIQQEGEAEDTLEVDATVVGAGRGVLAIRSARARLHARYGTGSGMYKPEVMYIKWVFN